MSLLEETRARRPELAAFLESCMRSPLSFDGEYPLAHSSANHIHLWALEYWADHHAWIDLDYRVAFVDCILEFWRGRLKGLAPYQSDGYRLYLYEDMAPTISVVAESPHGFPYGGEPRFVASAGEVLSIYPGRSWAKFFSGAPWEIAPDRLLAIVDRYAGSIGEPSANALGVKVGELRKLIEQMGLEMRVNAIRKRHHRRPAAFRPEIEAAHVYRVREWRLPGGFK